MKKAFLIIEMQRRHPFHPPKGTVYKVEKESLAKRFVQLDDSVCEQHYDYSGWYNSIVTSQARIIERFKYGKDAHKALRRLLTIQKVMTD